MARKNYSVTKSGKRSFRVDFRCHDDPTGGTIEFYLTASRTAEPDPGEWAAGNWGSYEALVGRAEADTPTIGNATAGMDITAFDEGRYVLWYRLSVGSEIDIAPWEDGYISIIS